MGGASLSALILLLAQGEPAAAPAPAPAAEAPNVTAYPPAFFAEFRPVSAMNMVTNIPGFSFDGGGNVRGFSANAGNVLIDGQRPPAGADSLSSILSRIPASSVLRIEVIRGGAPGIDMQGKTEVANVIRRPDGGVSGQVQAAWSRDSAGGVAPNASASVQRQAGGRTTDASISASLNDGSNAGESLRTNAAGAVLQQTRDDNTFVYRGLSVTAAREQAIAGGRARANFRYSDNTNQGKTTTELVIPGGVQASENSGQTRAGELGGRYSHSLPGGARIEGVILQQLTDNESVSEFSSTGVSSTFASERTNGQTVITANVLLRKRGNWAFSGGSEGAFNWFETSSRFALNGSSVFIPGDATQVDELRGEVFAAAAWTPKPAFNAEFSLRFERSTISAESSAGDAEKTLSFLKPRAYFAWRPAAGHELSLTIQRQVGQLSFNDFAVSASPITGIIGASNTDIEPDKTLIVDLRYEHTFGRRGVVALQFTHRHITDVLGRTILRLPATGTDPERIFDINSNVGPADRDLIRLSGNLPLQRYGLKDAYLNFTYEWYGSTIEDPVTGDDRRMSNETPYFWNLGLSQDLKQGRYSWFLGVSAEGSTPTFNPRSISYNSAGAFWNSSVTFRPRPDIILSLGASGAFQDRENTFILYTAPRDVGVVRYTEVTHGQNTSNIRFNARKTF